MLRTAYRHQAGAPQRIGTRLVLCTVYIGTRLVLCTVYIGTRLVLYTLCHHLPTFLVFFVGGCELFSAPLFL
jgi:predicted Abi (CAAX) family protease